MKNSLTAFLIGLTVIITSCGGSSDTKNDSSQSQSKPQASKPSNSKIPAFENVTSLQNSISQNGIGNMRKWRGDELGYMSLKPSHF